MSKKIIKNTLFYKKVYFFVRFIKNPLKESISIESIQWFLSISANSDLSGSDSIGEVKKRGLSIFFPYEGWTDGTEQCRFERPQIKKLFKNRPRCEITLGNEMDLDHFLDTFFDQNVNFVDVVVT